MTGGYEVFRVKRNPRSVSRETLIDEQCLHRIRAYGARHLSTIPALLCERRRVLDQEARGPCGRRHRASLIGICELMCGAKPSRASRPDGINSEHQICQLEHSRIVESVELPDARVQDRLRPAESAVRKKQF